MRVSCELPVNHVAFAPNNLACFDLHHILQANHTCDYRHEQQLRAMQSTYLKQE
jgi:hypothetical protein